MRFAWFALFGATALFFARPAAAQECRRTCRVDETRDANGCCISAGGTTSSASPAPNTPLPRRCPAGTNWSESQHACIGRLECPAGSHLEPGPGHVCVADAVGCPEGSRREDGRCVADVHCPDGARFESGACVSDVTCPANTTLENGHCISSDVQCPTGTHGRSGAPGCEGDPVCPSGTNFVQDRGCVGEPLCAAGTHFVQDRGCVGETVCAPGTHAVEGRGCVDVCIEFANSRWDPDHGACTCQTGYTAIGGQCVAATNCPAGTDRQGDQCVPRVICPYGMQFVEGQGCTDTRGQSAEREFEAQQAAWAAQVAARRRANRWTGGPALQLFGGIGGGWIDLPHTLTTNLSCRSQCTTADVQWLNLAYNATLEYSHDSLFVGVTYTHVEPSTVNANGWSIATHPLDLFFLEIGDQNVGPVHTWRVGIQGGYDFLTHNGAMGALTYKSLFNIYGGIFVGFDIRVIGMLRFERVQLASYTYNGMGVPYVADYAWGFGGGVTGTVFLGYSIH